VTDLSTQSLARSSDAGSSKWGGQPGNARLTGALGALIFVALATEGLTLVGVRQYLSVHVFIGMLIMPAVAMKTASTGYRFLRYYTGDERSGSGR